jgi:hypothetical protein
MMMTPVTIPIPLVGMVLAAGVAAIVGALLALHRASRERADLQRLLVKNYEGCLRAVSEVLGRHEHFRTELMKAASDLPEGAETEVKVIVAHFERGQRALEEALDNLLRGEDRLTFDFDLFQREIRAADETLARVASALKRLDVSGKIEEIEDAFRVCRESAEAAKAELQSQNDQLRTERATLEQRLEAQGEAEEVRQLLEGMQDDLELLEECLVDRASNPHRDGVESELAELEEQIAELDAVIHDSEERIDEAGDDLARETMAQRLRLEKIKRGVLNLFTSQLRAERRDPVGDSGPVDRGDAENVDSALREELERPDQPPLD